MKRVLRRLLPKDWKYIAVRYPQEQLAVIQRTSVARLPRVLSYIERTGIGTRGAERPGLWGCRSTLQFADRCR